MYRACLFLGQEARQSMDHGAVTTKIKKNALLKISSETRMINIDVLALWRYETSSIFVIIIYDNDHNVDDYDFYIIRNLVR